MSCTSSQLRWRHALATPPGGMERRRFRNIHRKSLCQPQHHDDDSRRRGSSKARIEYHHYHCVSSPYSPSSSCTTPSKPFSPFCSFSLPSSSSFSSSGAWPTTTTGQESSILKESKRGGKGKQENSRGRRWIRLLYRRNVVLRSVLLVLCYVGVSACFSAILPPAATAATGGPEQVGQAAGQTFLEKCVSFILHLDKHLQAIIAHFGEGRTYLLLTCIVFCETGLVITPFLPGDSLLFACGAFAALGSLKLEVVIVTLCCAAIAGDAVNYLVGNWVGKKILSSGLISEKHVQKTEKFYEKHGGKTVVMARFVPIVRTFAPFVAGIGSMQFNVFTLYNIAGALIWTLSFTLLGYFFGNLPFVQKNFTVVVLGIVAVSVLPVVYELLTGKD